MLYWYLFLGAIVATAAALAGLGWRRRLSIVKLVPMVLADAVGVVLLVVGLALWFSDPLAPLGEYEDDPSTGGDPAVAWPFLLVAAVLLFGAWFPALRGRNRRSRP